MNFDLLTWIGMFATFACVTCTLLILVSFINDLNKRYSERFVREASTEMEDVLIELPPEKLYTMSIFLGLFGAMLGAGYVIITAAPIEMDEFGMTTGGLSWFKLGFIAGTLGILFFLAPRIYIRHKRKQRLLKFNEQLVDALGSISSSLKAGFSINQAVEVIASERNKPISDEFTVLVREMRLGVTLDDALDKMNTRIKSDDFALVAAAIITARQTGGELTTVLERLAAMIRERLRITNRIQALTAQGRMQAYVIGAMPYLLLIAMSYVAAGLTTAFYNSPIGIIALVIVTILVICGFLTIRKITNIDV